TVIVNKLHFFERVFYFNPFTCNTFTIIVAPSTPQLNPIERFWLFLKSQIKGQVFNTLEELRDCLNELFSTIISERVISLTSYDFLLEALFYAASM
ncbi:MAG: hypothetical protein V7K89_35505, partial [Nostoc sp.]